MPEYNDEYAVADEAQQGPEQEPWSEERREAWDAGYLAGLNDATKITADALRHAMQRQRERIEEYISTHPSNIMTITRLDDD